MSSERAQQSKVFPSKSHQSIQVEGADVLADQQTDQGGNQALKQLFASSSSKDLLGLPQHIRDGVNSQGQPLDETTREQMEASFGYDFQDVRIHTGISAMKAAESSRAKALTVGKDIIFANGMFAPTSAEGLRLLSHELAHVVHQSRNLVNDQKTEANRKSLEADANLAATAISQGQQVAINSAVPAPPVQFQQAPEETGEIEWQLDENGQLTRDSLDRLEAELLRRDVHRDSIGTLEECSNFAREGRLNHLLHRLDQVRTSGIGTPNRVVNAWNAGKDDLGTRQVREGRGRREGPYPTILHFIERIDVLARETIPGSNDSRVGTWEEGVRLMPTIRLAGRSIRVHPRALYFVARAQILMDIRAGLDANQRHYVAPGLYRDELRAMRREIQSMLHTTRLDPAERDVQMQRIILQLVRMDAEMARQRSGQSDVHSDPQMAEWFRTRHATIMNAAEAYTPATSEQVAASLLSMLDVRSFPEGVTHGQGSADPHGTDHALGIAIDFGNAAGDAAYTNMGIPRQYLPFVWSLLDHYWLRVRPDPYRLGGRSLPGGVRGLRIRSLGERPELGRVISQLLSRYGEDWRQRIDQDLPEDERSREERDREGTVMSQTRTAMRQYAQHLSQFESLFSEGLRERMQVARQLLYEAQSQSRQETAVWLREELTVRIRPELEAIWRDATREAEAHRPSSEQPTDSSAERQDRARSRRSSRSRRSRIDQQAEAVLGMNPNVAHARGPSLDQAISDLQTVRVDTFADRRRLQSIVRTSGFRRWLENITRYPQYDQSTEMIESLEGRSLDSAIEGIEGYGGVRGRFMEESGMRGDHHWLVVDRNVIEDAGDYRTALEEDMDQRTQDELIRIRNLINESNPSFIENDPILRSEFEERGLIEEESAGTESP